MDGKGHSDDVSGRNGERVLGQWREGNSGYKVTKSLAEFCSHSSVLKVEPVRDELGI